MSGYITRGYRCPECTHYWEETISRDEDTGQRSCTECGVTSPKVPVAPAAFRVAYHDGKDRGDGYRKLKEAAQLEKKKANLPHEKRGDIQREINTLKKV